MRLLDYDHPATWWLIYRQRTPGGDVTYGREWAKLRAGYYRSRAEWLDDELPAGRGLIVGAAFGFLLEELRARGRDVWGVDSSGWIHRHLEVNAQEDVAKRILNIDIVVDDDPKKQLEYIAGGPFEWVLTEEVMSAYDDDGASELGEACQRIAPYVAHIINTVVRKPFNTHTLAEWKLLLSGQVCYNPEGVR